MIAVEDALRGMPHFDKFCSVAELNRLVEDLRGDARFDVRTVGTSAKGAAIHHVRFGAGRVKALLVAFPDCMEPIGGLTVFSLLHQLKAGNPALLAADVAWHIVPCIDPDGAQQNESWTQVPFTLENFVRNYYVQARADQVDNSFPIAYKTLVWDRPSREARILQQVLDQVRPDFFFSLHNAWTGGAFYLLSRDIGTSAYAELHQLLRREGMPLQTKPIWKEVCTPFAPGAVELYSVRKYYDCLAAAAVDPTSVITGGTGSWDYLAQIKPDALSFVAEIGYVEHPEDGSHKPTEQNLRQFKLRLDADSKYLATLLLEEWERVKDDVDQTHPVYRSVTSFRVFPARDKLAEGPMPLSRYPTHDSLFNPAYSRTMTEGERFDACMTDGGFFFLLFSCQFLRLLHGSPSTPAIRCALERLEPAFANALSQLDDIVGFNRFKPFDCDTLARVQLGSGLIALNTVLAAAAS